MLPIRLGIMGAVEDNVASVEVVEVIAQRYLLLGVWGCPLRRYESRRHRPRSRRGARPFEQRNTTGRAKAPNHIPAKGGKVFSQG